jgi:hypothetical protein
MTAVIVLAIVIIAVLVPTIVVVARDARPRSVFNPAYDSRRPDTLPGRLNR